MGSTSPKAEGARDRQGTVIVGRVRRCHGVLGDVLVAVESDVPGRFAEGSSLLLTREGEAPRAVRVDRCRPHRSGLLLRLEGFADRTSAEPLVGAVLEVAQSQVPPPPPGTFYHFQLLGCRCRDRSRGDLGVVVEVLEDGGGVLLVVEKGDLRVPIPFVASFIEDLDIAAGTILLRLPPDLVETCASRS